MNFDPTIGLGSILVLVTLVIGGLGAFYTLRGDSKETRGKVDSLEIDHGKITDKLMALELSVARECVKKSDIEAVEGRLTSAIKEGIGVRLSAVEHTTRSIETKLTERLLAVLTSKGARE